MLRNERKLQILQMLVENPLSVEEIAGAAGISRQNAAICVLRYSRQSLVEHAGGDVYRLTARGRDRIEFLMGRLVTHR